MKKRIYLDNNASTAAAPEVIEAVRQHLLQSIGNPSNVHAFGREARQEMTRARDLIANYLRVKPSEITFTSGGTESANLLVRGVASQKQSGHIITSNAEHSAVMKSVEALEKKGFEATYLSVGSRGAADPEDVRKAIRPDTRMITLMAANNETGVKTDLEAIAKIAKEHEIPLVVDGVALLGKESFLIPEGVTGIGFSGQKIHGLKGSGFIYLRGRTKLSPLILGGGHEQGRRAGTENLPGIVGLAKAVEMIQDHLIEYEPRVTRLRDRLESQLLSLGGAFVNGEGPRVCNTLNISFSGVDGESLLTLLDREGVAVSHGSACSSGNLEPSRVLQNMGLSPERVDSALRISLSRYTTEEEIESAAQIIANVVKKLRN